MIKTKLLAGLLLVFMLLAAQAGMAAAAPLAQNGSITGTIKEITTETDANGVTSVLVTLEDDQGSIQTVRISDVTADELGLFDLNTQAPVPTQIGQPVVIDPTTVIPDQEPAEESVHPIAALLATFFFPDDPDMASVIDVYHEDGFGFGVIAQALWMSKTITETAEEEATLQDATLAGCILQAKRDGTYDACFDFGGDPVPTNWGQFKKTLRENKQKHNLGTIVSGQAENDLEAFSIQDSSGQQDHGNGRNKDKGKNKNKNKNHP
jgi:hypothetical protein